MTRSSLITMDIEGAEFIEQALRDLGSDAEIRLALGTTMLQSAEPMARSARSKAPKKSGRMAETIDVSKTLSRRQKKNQQLKGGPDTAVVFLGAKPVGPSILNEFGTAMRHWKTGKSTGHMTAKPFMRPAFEEEKFNVITDFGKRIWVIIDAAARRIARRQQKGSK